MVNVSKSWGFGGKPAGLAFREGRNNTHFNDTNTFLLHTVKDRYSNNFDL